MSGKALAFSYLAAVAAMLGFVLIFGPQQAEGAEGGDTGHINEDTRVCEFNRITPDTVETYKRYDAIIDRLEEVGFEGLTPIEKQLGSFLTYQVGCGTVAQDYRIVLTYVLGDYILFVFDEGYGFDPLVFFTELESFHADELL